MSKFTVLLGLALAVATQLMTGPAAAAVQHPCSSGQFREFDYFVGRWVVKDKSGNLLGTDVVDEQLDGCVLEEHWKDGSGPGRGFGVIAFRSGDRSWQQTFVDNDGMVLVFQGRFVKGVMTFDGADYTKSGAKRLHNVLFIPRANGTLEERWRASTNGGRTWRIVFDGIFNRLDQRS